MFENIIINLKASTSGMGAWYNNQRKLNQSLSNINKDANRTSVGIARLGVSFRGLNNVIGVAKLMMMGRVLENCIQSTMDMTETVNLFNVAMGDTAVASNKTIQQMNKLYGLDPTNLQNSVGTFSLLARSMGMSTQQSSTLGINMAQLATDMSSLTNVPINQVMADLKSGLVGQSETVYKYGMDVTEAGIKQEALRQGITKSVREMSQGEKMALRYSAMIHQSGLAQGDFAKTIESPANQMRILGERFVTLGRAIGGIFLPLLASTLPYLNAFVMLLTDVANRIATFFGFKPPEVADTFKNALGGLKEDADDTTKSVGGTTKALKQMKSATMGFDELNIMPPDSSSSGGSGGGEGGGASILPDFKMPSYDNLMSGINSMADQIKKKILDAFKNSSGMFEPLIKSFDNLEKSVQPFVDLCGQGLKWAWDNVLVPLGQWTISEALPAVINLLAAAFTFVTQALIALQPLGEWLWNNLLVPIASWTGDLFVTTLYAITDALNGVSAWISQNQGLVQTMTVTVLSFMAAWRIVEILSFLGQSANVIGACGNIGGALKSLIAIKLIDIDTTIRGNLLYAKDFIVAMASGTVALVEQGAKWIWITGLKIADTIAQGAMTIATGAWNVVCAIATGLTTAFGVAVAFLTSPIGLVILAIGALIAIGILLYKNWDTIKQFGINAFSTVCNFVTKYFPGIADTISSVFNNVKKIFNGVIEFVTGVFTGNWRKAWQGLVDIFSGIFGYLGSIFKFPINAIIDGVNLLINGLNRLKVDIPDWVPGIGGKNFGINIPRIPHLARGGMLSDGALFQAGEAGKAEMIGSYNNKTTVMPLENTDFISSMYDAVYGAVTQAMSSGGGSGDLVLKVGGSEFGRVAINEINKITKQEGRLALNI